jgi:hypothetical protein
MSQMPVVISNDAKSLRLLQLQIMVFVINRRVVVQVVPD